MPLSLAMLLTVPCETCFPAILNSVLCPDPTLSSPFLLMWHFPSTDSFSFLLSYGWLLLWNPAHILFTPSKSFNDLPQAELFLYALFAASTKPFSLPWHLLSPQPEQSLETRDCLTHLCIPVSSWVEHVKCSNDFVEKVSE